MSEVSRIEEKAIEILQDWDRCDLENNMYAPDRAASLKVSWLLELAKKEKKDLVIEGDGDIYCGPINKHGHPINADHFTSRVVVDLGLTKATQDLCDDILSQLEDKYGPVEYQMREYFIEGITLIEVNNDSILVRLSYGT